MKTPSLLPREKWRPEVHLGLSDYAFHFCDYAFYYAGIMPLEFLAIMPKLCSSKAIMPKLRWYQIRGRRVGGRALRAKPFCGEGGPVELRAVNAIDCPLRTCDAIAILFSAPDRLK